MKSIGIIGGGITGLVTAYRLKQSGISVSLYEASDRVGGAVQSIQRDGYLAEAGPNTILGSSESVASLLHDLRLDSHKIYANEKAKHRYIVHSQKPVTVPDSPLSFLSSPLFSFGAKLNLMKEPFIPSAPADTEESLADFVRRRLGNEFLDYAVDPFVSGIYAGDPEKLSAKHSFAKIYDLEQEYGSLSRGILKKKRKPSADPAQKRSKMFSFGGGLQVLIDALSHQLLSEIKINTSVTRIEQTSAGWNVYYTDKGTQYIKSHSGIILTLPAYKIAELEHNVEGVDLSPFKEIYYPAVTSLALGFKRSDVIHPLDGFGMLIPKKENFHLLGTLFSSSLFPGRTPKDHVLLTSYVGGARQPDLAMLSESEQVELALKDLRTLLGVRGEPTFIHRTHFTKAIPQYNIGYGKYKDLMDSIEAKASGLYFAGNFRTGISLSDCITAANKLAEFLSKH